MMQLNSILGKSHGTGGAKGNRRLHTSYMCKIDFNFLSLYNLEKFDYQFLDFVLRIYRSIRLVDMLVS